MATYAPMAANDHHHHQPSNPSLPQQDHDQHHPPIRRSSGRRKPKPGCDSTTGPKKKPPQRGMGVEKLERLRLQERWKKMTEINPTNQAGLINAPHVSVQVPKLTGVSGPNCCQMGLNLNRNPNPNPSCNLDFHHHGQMGHVSDHHQLQTDLFGIGCLNNPSFFGKNVDGISKELSSSPNVVKSYVSEHCNACHKKKKLVNGENLGGGARMIRQSDMYARMYNVGECGFLGLNVGDNRSIINQENQGLGISAVPHVAYPVGNGKQVMQEVVTVHRKLGGSFGSEGGNNHVLMEYEFFPSSSSKTDDDGDDDDDDDLVMMNQKKVCSESSSTMAGFDAASNKCIDLSLKLSY